MWNRVKKDIPVARVEPMAGPTPPPALNSTTESISIPESIPRSSSPPGSSFISRSGSTLEIPISEDPTHELYCDEVLPINENSNQEINRVEILNIQQIQSSQINSNIPNSMENQDDNSELYDPIAVFISEGIERRTREIELGIRQLNLK